MTTAGAVNSIDASGVTEVTVTEIPLKPKRADIDLSHVELIDRGVGGKFVWIPEAVRDYLYGYLDIDGLFPEGLVNIQDANLSGLLRRMVKNNFSTPIFQLIPRLEEIKEEISNQGYPGDMTDETKVQVGKLLKILETESALIQDQFSNNGVPADISADELAMFMNVKGRMFSYKMPNTTFGFVSDTARVVHGFFGSYIEVRATIYASFGEGIGPVKTTFELPYFRGRKTLKEIGVTLLSADKESFDELVARGKRYVDMVTKPSYMRYDGVLVRKSWWSENKFKANGRVLIDCAAMRNMDPDYRFYFGWDQYERRQRGTGAVNTETYTDEQYAAMSPFVYGFSFASKVWGEMLVDNVSNITFRDDAYDMLVMEKETKDMVFALVDNNVAGAKDFIDGKGGGCIFLLAGPPGGGKTLTAEAIAERLNRPLYMVGVGELGTDVISLEENLRKILDVATTWNAVLLIDECDIFMEARSEMDVERNAMVGVFLRLLEYYEGVLFLTTNRAQNIDPAFYSRISMALYYEPLEVDARKIVWTNLLKVFGIDDVDVEQLAHYDLNGRKIKGVIRIAKALAAAENRTPTIDDFVRVIDKETAFKKAVGLS